MCTAMNSLERRLWWTISIARGWQLKRERQQFLVYSVTLLHTKKKLLTFAMMGYFVMAYISICLDSGFKFQISLALFEIKCPFFIIVPILVCLVCTFSTFYLFFSFTPIGSKTVCRRAIMLLAKKSYPVADCNIHPLQVYHNQPENRPLATGYRRW